MLKGNNNDEQMLYLASLKIAANFNLSFTKAVVFLAMFNLAL